MTTYYKMVGDGPLKRKVTVDVSDATVVAQFRKTVETQLISSINSFLNSQAVALGFDDAQEASSYASTQNQYTAISSKFVTWRAAVWSSYDQALAGITVENYSKFSVLDFMSKLPSFSAF